MPPRDPQASVHKRKCKKNPHKNVEKNQAGGWCTDDLYFDQEGSLYIKNETLADMIEQTQNAWGGRITIVRRKKGDPPDPDDDKDDGGGVGDQKVNMMCPCAPEP